MTPATRSAEETHPRVPASRTQVYVLLDVAAKVASLLGGAACVTEISIVEGPPDLIFRIEAQTDVEMVKKTIEAVIAVEDGTLGVRCLRVQSEQVADGAE